jgi:hypothetical protein
MQLYVLQFSLWSHMCRLYGVIREALAGARAEPGSVLERLRERVESDWERIVFAGLHEASSRDIIGARRGEIYEHAQRGVRGFREETLLHLPDAFIPARDEVDEQARLRLRELLRAHAPSETRTEVLDTVADAFAEFLAIERPALRTLDGTLRQVNALLQRPHPARKFSGADLAISHNLRVGTIRMLPYLMDILRDELGITVENTEDGAEIALP